MLYCFDVDGTLIRSFLREGASRSKYDLVKVLPGRVSRLFDLKQAEPRSRFAIVTNQAGVAMGYQTEWQVRAKMAKVVSELGMWDVPLTVHIAYEHAQARVPAYKADRGIRKPGPGMLIQAMRQHESPPAQTEMIGDMPSDEQAARAAGVHFTTAEVFFG